MSRASNAGNSVVKACEDICLLYRVPVFRMQSRTFTVKGAGGRDRPMFIGTWMDDQGYRHTKGMPDLLCFPKVNRGRCNCDKLLGMHTTACATRDAMPGPLWIECKAGSGMLTDEQKEFREWAMGHGHFHVEAHDSCEPVIQWFKKMGIIQ